MTQARIERRAKKKWAGRGNAVALIVWPCCEGGNSETGVVDQTGGCRPDPISSIRVPICTSIFGRSSCIVLQTIAKSTSK